MVRHPGILAAGATVERPTIERQYFSAEISGTVDGGDLDNWTQLVGLSFMADADRDYLIFWSCELQFGTTSFSGAVARIAQDDVELDRVVFSPGNISDWSQQGAFLRVQNGGAPQAINLSIDISRANDTFDFIPRGRNGRIIALRLEEGDEYVENIAPQNTSSAAPTDAVTLSFTPDTAGSYLVLGVGILNGTSTADPKMRLYDGTNGTPDRLYRFGGGSAQLAGVQSWLKTGVSGAQAWRLQWWSPDTATLTITGSRIVALRLDGFTHAFTTVSNADEQGAETGYASSLTLSRIVKERDYLALAVFQESRDGSSALALGGKFTDSLFGDVSEGNQTVLAGEAGTPGNPFFCARLGSYLPGRREWSIQRRAPIDADAVIREGALIALFQLN